MLIGCDGSNSVVAKFLALHPASLLPLWITRGFTTYPNGHPFDKNLIRIESKDVIVGRMPINDNLVSFFLTHLHPPEGSVVNKDREFIREYALDSVQDFPSEIVDLVKGSDINTLNLTKTWYRAPWHLLFAKRQKGTVMLLGDALHVMGPFLGQGGSAGLEDTIVLARALSRALPNGFDGVRDDQEIDLKKAEDPKIIHADISHWVLGYARTVVQETHQHYLSYSSLRWQFPQPY